MILALYLLGIGSIPNFVVSHTTTYYISPPVPGFGEVKASLYQRRFICGIVQVPQEIPTSVCFLLINVHIQHFIIIFILFNFREHMILFSMIYSDTLFPLAVNFVRITLRYECHF